MFVQRHSSLILFRYSLYETLEPTANIIWHVEDYCAMKTKLLQKSTAYRTSNIYKCIVRIYFLAWVVALHKHHIYSVLFSFESILHAYICAKSFMSMGIHSVQRMRWIQQSMARCMHLTDYKSESAMWDIFTLFSSKISQGCPKRSSSPTYSLITEE